MTGGGRRGAPRARRRDEALTRVPPVQRRFGTSLEPQAEQRLRSASVEQVETWSLRILTATSLAELLADD